MPWIYEKVAAPSGLVIEHDHQTLMAEMDEITRVAADKTIEAGGRLTVLLRTFAAGMSKHLANEEMYVPQMLRESGYTQEDEQALVGKVMQSLSPKAFATMMPLIFYAMEKAGGYGPLTAEVFFGTLPPPVQEAYPAWKATFESDFLGVLKALRTPDASMKTVDVSVASVTSTLINGFRTARVDTSDLRYQADPAFKPDKAQMWKTEEAHDGWVHAHNAIRFEIGELKRVLDALGSTTLAEWQVRAVKAWWANHEVHVHEHHRNEDDVLNPVLRAHRVPSEARGRSRRARRRHGLHCCMRRPSRPAATSTACGRSGCTMSRSCCRTFMRKSRWGCRWFARTSFRRDWEGRRLLHEEWRPRLPRLLCARDWAQEGRSVLHEGERYPPFVWHLPGKGFKALRTLPYEAAGAH